jgi:hypothetical protein
VFELKIPKDGVPIWKPEDNQEAYDEWHGDKDDESEYSTWSDLPAGWYFHSSDPAKPHNGDNDSQPYLVSKPGTTGAANLSSKSFDKKSTVTGTASIEEYDCCLKWGIRYLGASK